MLTSLEAAKVLCQKSEWSYSNLKLNKLIYIAHMAHLGDKGEPLVNEDFEAWTYGPVLPNLYHEAKIFGSGPVKNIFHFTQDITEGTEFETLTSIYNQIGSVSGAELVAFTHQDGGAWDKHYKHYRGSVIGNNSITEEFSKLFNAK